MLDDQDELARLRTEINRLFLRVQALEQQQSESSQPSFGNATTSKLTGGTWVLPAVNRIGALTLLLGVIFFFKYAVDVDLIAAQSGCILGLFFGLSLIGAGEWLQRRTFIVAAQGISCCGFATVLTTVYAAFVYYHLLQRSSTFFGMLGISAVAVLLAFRHRSVAIAGVGFCGALVTPVLLRGSAGEGGSVVTLLYFVCLIPPMLFVGRQLKFVVVTPLLAAIALLCTRVQFGSHSSIGTIFATALAVGEFLAASQSRTEQRTNSAFLVAGHLAAMISVFNLVKLLIPSGSVQSGVNSILGALYGIGLLSFGLFESSKLNRTLGSIFLGCVIGKLYFVDIWSLSRVIRVSAFLGLGALLLVASYLFSRSDLRSGNQAKS